MIRHFLFLLLPVLCLPYHAYAAAKVEEVIGKSAVTAWLIQERSLPIIEVKLAFKHAGSAYDPDVTSGIAYMTSLLLGEGAGELDSATFKQTLANHAIKIHFNVDKDYLYVRMKTLREHKDIAFKLLTLALSQPRFDKEEIVKIRDQILLEQRKKEENPDYLAELNWNNITFANHPYSNPRLGRKETIPNITRTDLLHYAKTRLGNESMFVSIVGDVTPNEVATLIDKQLATLPNNPAPVKPINEFTAFPNTSSNHIEKNLPQTVIIFGQKALPFNHPDFYAAHLMNYILGGGGFESRLTKEIREKRGLAYSTYSYLHPREKTSILSGYAATRHEAAQQTLAIISDEIERLKKHGVTHEEFSLAKEYVLGSFALKMDSYEKLVNYLNFMQIEDLGIDFLERRNRLIEAVEYEDVNRVARTLLAPDKLTIVIVGQ